MSTRVNYPLLFFTNESTKAGKKIKSILGNYLGQSVPRMSKLLLALSFIEKNKTEIAIVYSKTIQSYVFEKISMMPDSRRNFYSPIL